MVAKPKEVAHEIYEYFGFEMSPKFKEALNNYTLESRNYKSKHSYSLAQYGYTKEDISNQLKDLMREFEMDVNLEA